MIWKYPILIREAHLDTFGHVNNATYMALYEEARWEIITANGYGLKTVQELKQGPVILDASIKFLRELKLREEITITSEMVHYTGRVGQIKQQMLKTDGAVASEALFTMGLFDLAQRKLIEPTPAWRKALSLP
jgi:YbgC/YbaW family acyl-CoA thioester hydrolase